MKLGIYSVFDKKTVVYGQPFFAHTHGHAIRMVQDSVDKEGNPLSKYPDDFTLYHIGVYNDADGIIGGTNPSVVVEVASLKGG